MKLKIASLIAFSLLLSLTFLGKLTVAVSIVPEETFVKKVAGDLVKTVVMIPPGYSPANYSPNPREMQALSDSSIYFSIGVPTESANIIPKLKGINGKIELVPLNEYVEKFFESRKIDTSRDPHIWISPLRVVEMVEIIAEKLVEYDSQNSDVYYKNAREFIKELYGLHNEILVSLQGLSNKSFIVYHPAFGYFADDYGLEMIALEEHGKQATPKRIQEVVDFAKENGIKAIFYQNEIDSKQTVAFAEEIGGETVQVAPLSPDYVENLRKMAALFKKVLEKEGK